MITTFIISGIVTAFYVALRSLQQLHVVHGQYWRVLPTSLLMGVGDVAIILLIVRADNLLIGLTNGIGGALGCYAAMALHKRMG